MWSGLTWSQKKRKQEGNAALTLHSNNENSNWFSFFIFLDVLNNNEHIINSIVTSPEKWYLLMILLLIGCGEEMIMKATKIQE